MASPMMALIVAITWDIRSRCNAGAVLAYAADQGCDLAMMCALPGSGSQRNAERHGFRIAYTRIKWQLPSNFTAVQP